MDNISSKIQDIAAAQKGALIGRDEEIDGVWLTILSGEHGFLFGPPGVAKSMIVSDTARYFPEFGYFYHLMAKTTVPEELYGPVSITKLREDKYEHNVAGYLPTSDIAFLDEGFKAGATILNTLLRIMNEREFRNGTNNLQVPLKSMFIASNEIPTETELNALHDRILFRFNVQDLKQGSEFSKLLKHEGAIRKFLTEDPVATLSAQEYEEMRERVNSVVIPEEVLGDIVDIRDTLSLNHGITASSRRWLKTLKGVRAHAAYYGRDEALTQDLVPLTYMLWNQLDEIPAVKSTVWEIANPMLFRLIGFRDRVTELMADMEEAIEGAKQSGSQLNLIMVEYNTKFSELKRDIKLTQQETQDNPNQHGLHDKLDYMAKVVEGAKIRLATEAGGIDPEAVSGAIEPWEPEKVV